MTTQTHTATGTFTVTSWSEEPVYTADDETVEVSGMPYPARGFTRAAVTYSYAGDVSGTGTIGYLIAYIAGQSAPTVGFQGFEGTIDGHEGTLVLQHSGEHDATAVRERLEIVPGLGTGGLADMRGHADVELAGHSEDGYPITFEYSMG
ncbi:DUF3224 domain-containing protein [Gordonia soli]|uniref:DUF3224 domain-containing protein n=1 Tax=Gordonia soli NBRC 108243 TaxID=1223545 RepID=M0QKX6_9ACTN|nr:DUF3224 domain-containing protein [Gordonia soli]GAC69295.1 hypothetical protein GS4_23_00920 [Gordonia soli NBRC 108243]